MNNGKVISQNIVDQITFQDSIYNFQSVKYSPYSGKLVYGRGKYGLLFSHSRSYGVCNISLEANIFRITKQQESFYTFDEKDNLYSSINNGFIMGSSKATDTTTIFTGKYFLTASIGDTISKSIKLCIVDPNAFTNEYDFIQRKVASNGGSCVKIVLDITFSFDKSRRACGRLGGLSMKDNMFGLVYYLYDCNAKGIYY